MEPASYVDAIASVSFAMLRDNPDSIVMGQGVNDDMRIYGTTAGLVEEFGPERVLDTPISEEGMMGVAIGMALSGTTVVQTHIRMDFLLLAMNQLVNIAAKVQYMWRGDINDISVPLVIRAVVGRSWGQGPQHSQSLGALFAHIPGLRVVAPTTPYDAEGALRWAVQQASPTIFIEHRMLHKTQYPHSNNGLLSGPGGEHVCPPGRCRVMRDGEDLTIVGVSYMALEALRAAEALSEVGIEAKVIDPVWYSPFDAMTIRFALDTTKGRLLVVDAGHFDCGLSQMIMARSSAERGRALTLPESPCPTTPWLEKGYYPDAKSIAEEAYELVKGERWVASIEPSTELMEFKGPF